MSAVLAYLALGSVTGAVVWLLGRQRERLSAAIERNEARNRR